MNEEVKPPKIPEKTQAKMAEFFMKTSVPRILEQMRKEKEGEQNDTDKSSVRDE